MAAVNGKLYARDGYDDSPTGEPVAETDAYDPATNSWSTVSPNPHPVTDPGVAVASGKIYFVGGCSGNFCFRPATAVVVSYDPTTDTWATLAPYPHPVAGESCAGIDGTIYCSGGYAGTATYKDGYAYDPATDTWSPIADMPIALWGSAYGESSGQLVVSSGVTSGNITNQGFVYDPGSDSWSPLPNAQYAGFNGGGACGLYKVGGNGAQNQSERLADLDCDADVPWLAENPTQLTLAPGASADVTVTLTATPDAGVTQPGTYTARLGLDSNTPYPVSPIDITMTVTPPTSWGKITGTVTGGTDCSGTTAPLQTAQIQANGKAWTYSLKTSADGKYTLWAPSAANPFTIIASKDRWISQSKKVKIKKQGTTTVDFALQLGTC